MLLGSSRGISTRPWCTTLVFLLLFGAVRSVWALDDADRDAIRSLSDEAAAEFEQGRFEAARDKFTIAYALIQVPRLAVWMARVNERLGKLLRASDFYRQAIQLERNDYWIGDLQTQAQKEAKLALLALNSRLAKVTVVLEGATAERVTVKLDGVVIPAAQLGLEQLVDPGQHEIVGTESGAEVREVAKLDEGGRATIVLKFRQQALMSPSARRQPSRDVRLGPNNPQRTWGWVGLGVGGAGLLTGAVSGLLVISQYTDLKEDCPDLNCAASYRARVDRYETMRTVSTAGFIVGGVGAAVGVTLLLTSPATESSKAAQNLGLWATPQMAGVTGTF